MQGEITVPIPKQGADLVAYFQAQLGCEFRDALDFDEIARRDRAVLDKVKVTDVTITEYGVEVEY